MGKEGVKVGTSECGVRGAGQSFTGGCRGGLEPEGVQGTRRGWGWESGKDFSKLKGNTVSFKVKLANYGP